MTSTYQGTSAKMSSSNLSHEDAIKSSRKDQDAESILEAIEVGSTHDDQDSGEFDDPEKAPTQASLTKHDPATSVTTAQDWTGVDDPGNPHNWSTFKKAYHFWPVSGQRVIAKSETRIDSLYTGGISWLRLHHWKQYHLARKSRLTRVFSCLSNGSNCSTYSLCYRARTGTYDR